MPKSKPRFTLAVFFTHLSMFQVHKKILIFPLAIFPVVIFLHGDLSNGKVFFPAFIHIYIIYGIDPAQLLHVVVKQVSKLYLDLLGHKPKGRFSLYADDIPVFTVKLHMLEPPAYAVSL